MAPGRAVMRSLVGFLRGEGINVRTVADAEGAFEEALLHPPDIVLIDDRVPPSGGIDLVVRLKANVRTHFVPTILYTLNDLRRERVRALAAGADAVFAPNDGRRRAAGAHLGAAAHAGAVPAHRSAAAHPAQRDRRPPAVAVALPARPQGADRRARRQRRVPGSVRARRRPIRVSPTSRRASRTRAASSSRSRRRSGPCSTTTDSRPASSCPRDERFRLGEAAAEPIETLRRLAAMAERNRHGGEPAGRPRTHALRRSRAGRVRDPEPGDGGAAPVGGAQRAGDRDRRDRRGHALPHRRAGRAAAAERTHQHLRALRTPRRGHRRCTASAWRSRALSSTCRKGRCGSRTCRRAAARSCSSWA